MDSISSGLDRQAPVKRFTFLKWLGALVVVVVLILVWVSWRTGGSILSGAQVSSERDMLDALTPKPDSPIKMSQEEVQAAMQATTPPTNSKNKMTDAEIQAALEATTPPQQ